MEASSRGADGIENYRITEINARFCFNGFMHQAYGQTALDALGVGSNGVTHATDSEEVICLQIIRKGSEAYIGY